VLLVGLMLAVLSSTVLPVRAWAPTPTPQPASRVVKTYEGSVTFEHYDDWQVSEAHDGTVVVYRPQPGEPLLSGQQSGFLVLYRLAGSVQSEKRLAEAVAGKGERDGAPLTLVVAEREFVGQFVDGDGARMFLAYSDDWGIFALAPQGQWAAESEDLNLVLRTLEVSDGE
jgi:hypothetical protein